MGASVIHTPIYMIKSPFEVFFLWGRAYLKLELFRKGENY